MLRRYIDIHDELVGYNNRHDSEFVMNCSAAFLKRQKNITKCWLK